MSKTYLHLDDRHQYTLRDKETHEVVKELISTSELMRKHGLSVDYSEVPPHVMENARLFGDVQHAWLEKYFKGEALKEELSDVSRQGIELLESSGLVAVANEQKTDNGLVAGTVDMLAMKEDKMATVDFKFTYSYNAHSIMWQLNIYRLLLKQGLGIEVDELYCLWYEKPKKTFHLRLVPMLEDEMVYKLFDAEMSGEKFVDKQNNIMNTIEKDLKIDRELKKFYEADRYIKKISVEIEALKEELRKEMEAHGIKSYETENFKITYVGESKSITYDHKKIKEDFKDIIDYTQYEKVSNRKSYIKISEKEVKI